MKHSYLCGVLLASCVCGALVYCGVSICRRVLPPEGDEAVAGMVFVPEVLDGETPACVMGQQRTLDVQIQNVLPWPVQLKEIRFSDPCVELSPQDASQIPRSISPGASWPFRVSVSPSEATPRRLSVRMDARGTHNGTSVTGHGVAFVHAARGINAEPALLSLGVLKKENGIHKEIVRIWHPTAIAEPRSVTIESDDPAVSATSRHVASKQNGGADRTYFQELLVAVDPDIAPSRLSTVIRLHSDAGKTEIPVFGWIEQ